jgi:predicted N-acyltransferase
LLSLHRTIREIAAEDWNQLTEQNAFATHGWLLTVETCCRASIQPLYFSLRQGAALVAASVCYVIGPTGEMETLDDMLLGRLTRSARWIGLGFLPAVVCGPLMGYGWHIGVSPDLNSADAHKARQQLLDAIEAEARTLRLQAAFVHILDEEAELKKLLDERRYLRCRNAPVAVLDLSWNSFEDYLAGLTSKRRIEFRRQISRNQEAGNLIEFIDSPGGDEARLLELLDENARKHNTYPFPFGPGFFDELKRNLGPHAWIVTARKTDQPSLEISPGVGNGLSPVA